MQDAIKKLMRPFNNEEVVITDDTVMDEVISPDDGFPGARSSDILPKLINWTQWANGAPIKDMPEGWLKKTVRDLAASLICFLAMISFSFGQKPLQLTVGAVKTDGKSSALAIGVTYLPSLSFTGKQRLTFGKNSVFSINPNLEIQSGTADAFSSITAKITGLLLTFKTTQNGEIVLPDVSKVFFAFPFSLGVETSNRFDFINALFETGVVPWYQSATTETWLRHTKIGFFVQAGYKFRMDSAALAATGGQVDESSEDIDRGIFRLKGSIGADTKAILTIQGLKLGLVGSADGWYDILNSAVYYKVIGAMRVYLTGDNYLDLQYQRGSGAPNFNTGDQFGLGLTISL